VPSTEEPQAFATSLHRPYGFLNSHSGYFKHAGSSENEVNELGGGDAETISDEGRRQRREAHEEEKWDAQYYVFASSRV
jgi:protein SHQ1